MGTHKDHKAGDIFRQVVSFVLRMILKVLAFILWAIFKLISGVSSTITSVLEHYLDI